jgi:hypothetical protein
MRLSPASTPPEMEPTSSMSMSCLAVGESVIKCPSPPNMLKATTVIAVIERVQMNTSTPETVRGVTQYHCDQWDYVAPRTVQYGVVTGCHWLPRRVCAY